MRIPCQNCRKYAKACYNENRWVKWIDVSCECGFKKRMKKDELDTLQPSSPLFQLVYHSDPFKDYAVAEKNKAWENEKRKEALDAKYDKEFNKPWERKFVKDKVLFEK